MLIQFHYCHSPRIVEQIIRLITPNVIINCIEDGRGHIDLLMIYV